MQVLLLGTSAAAAAQNADWSIRTSAAILEAAIEATEGVGTDVGTTVTAVQADVENQELQMKARGGRGATSLRITCHHCSSRRSTSF